MDSADSPQLSARISALGRRVLDGCADLGRGVVGLISSIVPRRRGRDEDRLSPRARRIHRDLTRALAMRKT